MKAQRGQNVKKNQKICAKSSLRGRGHLTATSKLFCGKTLYLLLILFLSIALFAGLIFTVGDGSNGFLSNKPQDVSNAASSTPSTHLAWTATLAIIRPSTTACRFRLEYMR